MHSTKFTRYLLSISCVGTFISAVPFWDTSTVFGQEPSQVPELYQNLEFRNIGPAVTGGRIHDVEALADVSSTVYAATASGGIWKTLNKGTTWEPIFDDEPVGTFW